MFMLLMSSPSLIKASFLGHDRMIARGCCTLPKRMAKMKT
ncbi:hypothetical protein C5167_022596 [Papaver somniferum]|uniref:Uncharacterized protein n=1 Tax=Papaver somniferum TaxID=3469 RepID=A0A4Y7JMA3_PAPSO|nr:hypothetical protein C5167_022596 [Papaver somniferum]